MPLADVEVLTPASADEAIAAFGDGSRRDRRSAAGRSSMPELAAGRLPPAKALLLSAGRAGRRRARRRQGDDRRGGARSPRSRTATSRSRPPRATVADPEIRAQATVGGNVCSGRVGGCAARRPPGAADRARRDASARPAPAASGPSRSRTSSRTAHRPARPRRLATTTRRGRPGYAASDAPAHPPLHDPRRRGRRAGRRAARRRHRRRPARRADRSRTNPLAGLDPPDDALASAWYRPQVLPKLVERALADLSRRD